MWDAIFIYRMNDMRYHLINDATYFHCYLPS